MPPLLGQAQYEKQNVQQNLTHQTAVSEAKGGFWILESTLESTDRVQSSVDQRMLKLTWYCQLPLTSGFASIVTKSPQSEQVRK
mmetsp:Transcript_26682/g.61452  ORF Transcript_26682/g.61452 Transcript_26682/m.61452 type:complete len:84 (-) Transcript_26682:570-821(-)